MYILYLPNLYNSCLGMQYTYIYVSIIYKEPLAYFINIKYINIVR